VRKANIIIADNLAKHFNLIDATFSKFVVYLKFNSCSTAADSGSEPKIFLPTYITTNFKGTKKAAVLGVIPDTTALIFHITQAKRCVELLPEFSQPFAPLKIRQTNYPRAYLTGPVATCEYIQRSPATLRSPSSWISSSWMTSWSR
jgi:hypothetical protein